MITSRTLSTRNVATSYLWRAFHFKSKGELDSAISDLNEAIRLDPKNASVAYNDRGLSYNDKGEHDRAISDYNEAIRLDPKFAIAYNNRGLSYNHKGEHDRAISDYNEAIRLIPKFVNAYNNRGAAYVKKGEHDRAISDLSEAIRLDPKYAIAYVNRGIAFREKGDLDRALQDIEAALRLDPKHSYAYVYRGLLHEDKGERERARADFNAALAQPLPVGDSRRAHEIARQRLRALSATATVEPAPATDAPITAPATTLAPPAGRRVALVIGNGKYRHATQLANSLNDAADIARALRKLGFEVVEGRDLDKRGMEDKVREFGGKLDRADLALFFYAGHGIQVAGRNYLIPVDAKLERPGDLNFDTVDVSFILAQMEAEQRVNLVFLDACRDNPLTRSFARSLGTRSASVGQGLATMQGAVGTLIAFATGPDTVALDGEGRNSPFTSALLRHLATPGLHVSLLMQRVRADVVRMTRSKQVPWDHSSLIGDVILAR
jgi:tetratricopeptide (TPR) repeat protein